MWWIERNIGPKLLNRQRSVGGEQICPLLSYFELWDHVLDEEDHAPIKYEYMIVPHMFIFHICSRHLGYSRLIFFSRSLET